MATYDLVISASCYYSPEHALRLIRSTSIIDGRVLTVITCPRLEDAQGIAGVMDIQDIRSKVVILHTDRRERHLCQNLGFLYCHANNIKADYLMMADDDIEFTQSTILYPMNSFGAFSTFGFSSSWIQYGSGPFTGDKQDGKFTYNPIWIDGHNISLRWKDVYKYGLFDEVPGNYNSSFVEVELMHRYRILSDLPAIGSSCVVMKHHSRINNVEQIRDEANKQSVVHCGYQLWEKKYGMPLSAGDFNSGKIGWWDIYRQVQEKQEMMKRHLILDDIWVDYNQAWEKFGPGVHVIKEQL